MSKLKELIQQYCPDGVAYVALETVCLISKGIQFNKKDMHDEGTYPVINGGINPSGYIEQYNQEEKTITISQGGASAGFVNWLDTKFWAGAHCYVLKPTNNVLNRYLFHLVKSKEYKLQECQYGAGIPALAKSTVASLEIPVPPLPIQREIVRILDKFTELTAALIAELTAELAARKKQYGCYRDSLLSFAGNTDVKNVPLGDIAKFVYGYTDKAKETGSVRFVRITDISEDGKLNPYDAKYVELTEESKKYLLEKGDLLLARTGATYGKTLYFEADEPAVYASFLIKIILDNSVIKNRYYWHFSKSSLYWEQAERYVSKGGQQQFNTNAVSRVKVPVPSLEVQDKIIYVLDNFDAICSDLNIVLPAEIETRKKQYEFYRDALLTYAATGIIIATDRHLRV